MMGVPSYCGKCQQADIWCGACYEVKRCRVSSHMCGGKKGARVTRALPVDGRGDLTEPGGAPPPSEARESPDNWRDHYPRLWQFLNRGVLPGGTYKASGTLL